MPTGPPRAKSIELRLLGFMGVLVVLAALASAFYCFYQREAGRRELSHVRENLAADGILLPLASLVPPPSEAALANGQSFLASIEGLSVLDQTSPTVKYSTAMRHTAPGFAASAATDPIPVFDPSSATSPKSWEDFRLQLQSGARLITDTRVILQQPAALKSYYSSFRPGTASAQIQVFIAWLRADALLRLHNGNIPAALDDFNAIQQAAAVIGGSRTLTRNVLEIATWTYGLKGLVWEALQSPSLTVEDLRRLNKIVSDRDFVRDAILAMQVEAAMTPEAYQQIMESPSDELGAFFGGQPRWLLGSKPALAFRKALWQTSQADADQAKALSDWGEAIRQARPLLTTKNWPQTLAAEDALSKARATWRYPVAKSFTNLDLRAFLCTSVRAEMSRQLMVTAIALEHFRLKNAHYPDSLDQLVPTYLPALPIDWFDGLPLKYRPLPDRSYLLYSVDQNGLDDGGNDGQPDQTTSAGAARDLVWPRLQ